MEKKKLKLKTICKNNIFMLKIALKADPLRVILDFIYTAVNRFEGMIFSIFVLRYIFNGMEKGIEVSHMAVYVAGFALIAFILNIFQNWYYIRFRPVSDIRLIEKINLILFEKAASVDLACYENRDFFDIYTKAIGETQDRVISVLNNLTWMFGITVNLIIVGTVIYSIDPISILFAFIPASLMVIFRNKQITLQYKLDMDNIDPGRREGYTSRIVYLQKYAKELRLYNIHNVLFRKYKEAVSDITKNYKKQGLKLGIVGSILQWSYSIFISIGSLLVVVIRVIVFKALFIGSVVVLINAFRNFAQHLLYFVYNSITFTEYGLYGENLMQFLNYEPDIDENQDGITAPLKIEIVEFKNVSFKYEGSENFALNSINLKIKTNEKIAVVGHNGSGKSTLIKLLLRLYDPTEGEILLNGINIKEYNLKDYRRQFGVVFQDFKHFAFSIFDNVTMNDENICEEQVINALKSSDIYDKISTLPKGIHTPLTREFDDDGAVLSGGEQQKIAIARTLVKYTPFAILDEPTSALDPVAEYKMYENMMKSSENRSVIFISHRLSSAVVADRILMFGDGELIETGSHTQLISKNGHYAEMFRIQAEKYVDEIKEEAFA